MQQQIETMKDKLRIVFMGTPDFAVESLKTLVEAGQDIVGVITAPDKPAGRGQKIVPSPVKVFAENSGILNVLQPVNLKSPEFIKDIKALKADLQVVVAFRMLPEAVWAIPPKGTINLHASLLPDYRGAAPINWAIINGETETGVSTFFIEKEIDAGKIIYREKVAINPDTTAGELHDVLMVTGAKLLVKTVEAIAKGENPSIHQQEINSIKELHTAPKIFKEDCKIDWGKDGQTIHNFVRGLSPYPAAWTEIIKGNNPVILKIYGESFEKIKHTYKVGELITDKKKSFKVAVKDGFIDIKSLQQAGKKRMSTGEFLKGFQSVENYKLLV